MTLWSASWKPLPEAAFLEQGLPICQAAGASLLRTNLIDRGGSVAMPAP